MPSEVPRATKGLMLSLGTRLGPYEIVSSLGAGGMGEVEPFGRRLNRPAKFRACVRGQTMRGICC